MDLQEIRMRCVEAVAQKVEHAQYEWPRKVIERAKELEAWVLEAEEDALKRLSKT